MKAARHFILAILSALAIVGIFRLRIDVDILNLLPADNDVARGLAEYQDLFLQAGEVIIVLRTSAAESSEAAASEVVKALRARPDMVERAFWQPPATESLNDAAQFLAYLWLNAPTNDVLHLRESLRPENLPTTLAESRERIATSFNPTDLFMRPRDPLNLSSLASSAGETFETPERFFASEDGRTRLIYVYSAVPLNDYEQCSQWLKQLRSTVRTNTETFNQSGNLEIAMTGRPVFVDEISSGMRSDMATAVPGTLFLIGVLFYLLHREWISLALLLITLFGIMIWTALAGSAVLGQLNVVSVGFASILLGLAEDFGIVLHQELKSHPGLSTNEIRKIAGPSIFWSAVTTAGAFALLNLSSLPGLKHLGTLVALGIVIGAWAMTYLFLPMLIRFRRPQLQPPASSGSTLPSSHAGLLPLAVTIVTLLCTIAMLIYQPPRLDSSPEVLRPRKSEANTALKMVQATIGTSGDPYWLLVHGKSESDVRSRLEQLQTHLTTNSEELGITSVTLPLEVWPNPSNQFANAPLLNQIAADRERIFAAVLTNGFTPDALDLSRTAFATWENSSTSRVNWPEGRVAEWVLPKFVSREGTNLVALGLVTPGTNFVTAGVVPNELRDHVLLSGWSLLGRSVLDQVKREVPLIFGIVALTVVLSLWFTFRNFRGVFLSLAVLTFSGAVLLAVMNLMNWRWNLMNLVALPLLLAMGVDYSIHMQTALTRYQGDARGAFHTVGRALLLAGSTTIIGFGFLGTSSNLGMAGLGRVCALGLAILLLTSVFLLPAWVRLSQPSSVRP